MRRTLERNGLNLAPRLGAHTFTRMDGGKNSTSTGENSTRKVGAEFGDDFWMAALTDKEAPLSTPSDAEAAALHAMASPAAKRPTASPAVRERDEDALSQASTQRWGITPTSQNISPVTDDGTPRPLPPPSFSPAGNPHFVCVCVRLPTPSGLAKSESDGWHDVRG